MAKERGSTTRKTDRNRLEIWTNAVALAGIAFLLLSPFLMAPGKFLYIRYFDADTLFGPWWRLHELIGVWDAQRHLGFAHARDLSYLSIQELLSVIMSPLGLDFRNRSSLVAVSLLVFFSFWWYLRVRFPRVPGAMSAVAALFYAANPFVVSFIHDGYSGLLVDYALLPLGVLMVEWARRSGKPILVSLLPVVFVVTGMYSLTSVVISLIGIVAFEYRYLWFALRSSLLVIAATLLGFALNVYWALPLAYDLVLHPSQPILAESANDIAALTSAGTLTNALLLRSYPEIWTKAYGARECVGCIFYQSPWFLIAMSFVAVCAFVGLLRARHFGLAAVLAGAIVLTTGYHYQGEVLGLPYLILMSLPTFDIFRGSVKFSALIAAFYGVGLIHLYAASRRGRAAYAIAAAVCVTFVAFPYIAGNMIERSPDNPPHFPNFTVSVPSYYSDLQHRADLLPRTSPALLVPNMPLAAYRWGAYGNDFLTAFLARPTLSVDYLPQPNWQLEQILKRLTAVNSTPAERQAYLRALGIRRILYRDDVTQTTPLPKQQFGRTIASFGAVAVLDNSGAFPPFWRTQRVDSVFGAAGVAAYAGLFHRAAWGYSPGDDARVCRGQMQLGIEPLPTRRKREKLIKVPTVCRSPLVMDIFFGQAKSAARVFDAQSKKSIATHSVHLQSFSATEFILPPGSHGYIIQSANGPILAVAGKGIGVSPYPIQPITARTTSSPGFVFPPFTASSYVVFNENFDPAWAGYVKIGAHWQQIRNFTIDGFANAWQVPANSPLLIVNTLIVFARISAILALIVLAAYIFVFVVALRSTA